MVKRLVGKTPFERFFLEEFPRRLDSVDGQLADASWDRKAAYLLWQAENKDKEMDG